MSLSCEQLVEAHLDAVHGLARAWTGDTELAKELVQRTYLKAFQKRGQLREVGAARAWLLAILRNEIAGEHRVRSRFEVWEAEDFEALPEEPELESSLDPALFAGLPRALDRLAEGHRRILLLRYQQDLEYAQIAELLGVPIGTVMSRLHRAKSTLKAILQRPLAAGGEPC